MSAVVFLDSGPLGLIVNPGGSSIASACNHWLRTLILQGVHENSHFTGSISETA